MAERWTREQYEKYLDDIRVGWREERTIMSCTCDYEDCHGWVSIRHGLEKDHEEEEADRASDSASREQEQT